MRLEEGAALNRKVKIFQEKITSHLQLGSQLDKQADSIMLSLLAS